MFKFVLTKKLKLNPINPLNIVEKSALHATSELKLRVRVKNLTICFLPRV